MEQAAVETLSAAFAGDPLVAFIAPDPRARARWIPEIQRAGLRLCHDQVYVAADRGEVLGVMALLGPDRAPPGSVAMARFGLRAALFPTPWCPPPLNLLRARPYGVAASEFHPAQPHWYLHALGVHPSSQGQGVGGALLRHMLDLAVGLPIHLQTNDPVNVALYTRYGFEVTHERRPHRDGPQHWGMLRPAQPRPPSRATGSSTSTLACA